MYYIYKNIKNDEQMTC